MMEEHGKSYDLSFLENLSSLKNIRVNHIGELDNIEVLNNMPNLYFADLTFQEESRIIASIPELQKINNRNLNIAINSNSNLETDDATTFLDEIKKIKVNRIYFSEMYKNVVIENPIELGKSVTYTFNEINPWFEEYLLNSNSIFYNESFRLISNSENVIIDNDNKTITLNTNNFNESNWNSVDISYYYVINFDTINGEEWGEDVEKFSLTYQIIETGDTNSAIYIPDSNLRQLFLDAYDIDGEDRKSVV